MKKFLTFVSLAVILFACLTAAFRMADMPLTYQGQDAAVPVAVLLMHAPDVAISEAAGGAALTPLIFIVALIKIRGGDDK